MRSLRLLLTLALWLATAPGRAAVVGFIEVPADGGRPALVGAA